MDRDPAMGGGVSANSSSDFVSCFVIARPLHDDLLTMMQVRKLYKYAHFQGNKCAEITMLMLL